MIKNIFSLKRINYILILLIIIYPLLWVPFGIDITDTGYVMFYYKNIFNHPEVISNSSSIILSSILGGLWIKIFPFMEYTSCKLAYALIIIFINFLLYKIFIDIFKNKTLLLISLLLATTCIMRPFIQFMNYSVITVLFFILGTYFLYNGITKNSKTDILISSAVFSLNTFVRLPNILGLSFVLMFWIWNFINIQAGNYKTKQEIIEKLKSSLKFSGIFLAGYLITAIIFLLILKLTGTLGFYIAGMNELLLYSKLDTSYSSNILFNIYLKAYQKAILISINFIGIFWSFYEATKCKFEIKNAFRILTLIFIILFFICLNTFEIMPFNVVNSLNKLITKTFQLFSIRDFWHYMTMFLSIGIFLFIPAFILFNKKAEIKLKLLSLIGILIALISFAGSNAAIYNIPGYWIIAVISAYYVLNYENTKDSIKKIGTYFVIFLLILSVITKRGFFSDSKNTISLNTPVNNHMFWGSYTTKERASAIKDFIKISPKYIKKNDLLLAWPSLPLMHYMTDSLSAVGTPWPTVMDYRIFKNNLEIKEKNNEFPVILISKYLTTSFLEWPRVLIKDPYIYNSNCSVYSKCDVYSSCIFRDGCEEEKIVTSFIKRNNYQLVWENDVFEIYKRKK